MDMVRNAEIEKVVGLRPMDARDLSFLQEVYASTRIEELIPLNWPQEQMTAFLQMQFQAQHAHYQSHFPGADFRIVLREGKPIGRLYVHRTPEEIRIIDIALLPEYRREGIGTYLLKSILAEAAATGRPVRICVERFNPALALYERLGFSKNGDTGVYRQMEWRPQSLHLQG
jgi:RimJ/RimL family protein N-acetyltransferase